MRNLDTGPTIVIGAGLAGLTAAWRLAREGMEVIVVEAEERVGGRAYTAREGWTDGQYTDYGGELVDADYRALIAVCEQVGVELTQPIAYAMPEDDDLSTVEGYLRVGTFVIQGEVLDRASCLAAGRLIRSAAEAHPPTQGEIVEQWILRARLAPREAGIVRSVARMLCQLDPWDCDVHFVFGKPSAGFRRIVGGTQRLAEALADGLDVRLGDPVARVHRYGGVAVETESGASYRGSRVVCATGPYAMAQIGFDPPMVEEKISTVQSLLPAMGGKVIAQYAEGDAIRERFREVVYTDDAFNACWVTMHEATSGPAIVTSFVTGQARHLLGDDDASLARLDELVGQVVDGPVTRLRGEVKNWWADPIAMGVTVTPYDPARPAIAGTLSAMERRTHMAGDYTEGGMAGTLEAAVRSGHRVADEILRTPQRFHIDDINERLARA
ncbi:FAD-dependent oxidoreductase [Nocardioides panacisoli]|uniref:flavin monoamine oxidase family protein n=1 Tax=Nocardioides panacisoli TaxID=627624 RepID=UPI001C62EC2D|nr:NAD(P)/FAD-dependent oxidoreductase [Nocardioides panacisoli]QYJ03522.1 FAD-dependent oxidoreductase [Nocardioides panacisoli]